MDTKAAARRAENRARFVAFDWLAWGANLAQYIVLGVSVLYVLVFVVMAFYRVPYPFELEWMEGSSVDHVRRVLAGQPIYAEPSVEFGAYIYTPLYFYISAAVSLVTGVGFTPLRLVSFLATLSCFGAIFALVRRETGGVIVGVVAAGMYAACFRIGGAWFDVARIDTLFLCWSLWSVYTLRFAETKRGFVLAGVLLGLAFFTKQSGLIVFLALALYLLLTDWRRILWFALGFGVIVVPHVALMLVLHGWWYWYYVFLLPSQHPLLTSIYASFWRQDLFGLLPLVCSLAVLYLVVCFARWEKKRLLLYGAMAGGLLTTAYLSRLHEGGYDNVLLPAYAALAVLFGLGLHEVLRWLDERPNVWRHRAAIAVYGLCLLQFFALIYNPLAQIPTSADYNAGLHLENTLAQIDGEIFMPDHAFLLSRVGKPTHIHRHALLDIERTTHDQVRAALFNDVRRAFEEQRFAAVVLDYPLHPYLQEALETYYEPTTPVFTEPDIFFTVTGMVTRPHMVYLPKNEAQNDG